MAVVVADLGLCSTVPQVVLDSLGRTGPSQSPASRIDKHPQLGGAGSVEPDQTVRTRDHGKRPGRTRR